MKSIVLPAGTEHVLFGDLAHLIADALWPDAGANDDRMTYACARINFDGELTRAVKSGALPVKDPLTLGPHTFPIGDALKRALVTVHDLREFVAGRGLSVLFQFTVNEDGGSTTFRATQEEYDAMAAGKQAQRDERHKRGHYSMYEAAEVLAAANSIGGTEAFLKKRMLPAVKSGALVLLDPIDGGPVTGRLCRPYDDWVTPKAIDEWLAGAGFTYLWPVAPTATQAPPVVPVGALGGTATVWTAERKEAARAMMNEQRGQGIKAFAASTAAAFGVTATRLREVLNDKPKKAPEKKGQRSLGRVTAGRGCASTRKGLRVAQRLPMVSAIR